MLEHTRCSAPRIGTSQCHRQDRNLESQHSCRFHLMPTAISNLVGLVQQRAEGRPDHPAYIYLSGEELRPSKITYRQLDLQARTIAAFLQRLELQGERVLLLYPAGLEFAAAFMGCIYAGVIAVPAYPPRM